jgi:hypothetical protein
MRSICLRSSITTTELRSHLTAIEDRLDKLIDCLNALGCSDLYCVPSGTKTVPGSRSCFGMSADALEVVPVHFFESQVTEPFFVVHDQSCLELALGDSRYPDLEDVLDYWEQKRTLNPST